MIFKTLLYFLAKASSKVNFSDDLSFDYCWASAITGFITSIFIVLVYKLFCLITGLARAGHSMIGSKLEMFLFFTTMTAIALYVMIGKRWEKMHEEVNTMTKIKKRKWLFISLLITIVILCANLMCNDIYKEIFTRSGPVYARQIVGILGLEYI